MIQELMLGLAVAFAYIIGNLLGYLTKDEGQKFRLKIKNLTRKSVIWLAASYGAILGFFVHIEIIVLLLFGLILAESSVNDDKHISKKLTIQSAVFYSFFLIIFIMRKLLKVS